MLADSSESVATLGMAEVAMIRDSDAWSSKEFYLSDWIAMFSATKYPRVEDMDDITARCWGRGLRMRLRTVLTDCHSLSDLTRQR